MKFLFGITAGAALASAVPVASVYASTFQATELSYDKALLSQFNLINLGDFSASGSQTIAGRTIVGGNLATTGTQTVCSSSGAVAGTSVQACGNSTTALGVTSSSGVYSQGGPVTATKSYSDASGTGYGFGALTVFGSVTGSLTSGSATAGTGGDINVKGSFKGPSSSTNVQLNNTGGANMAGGLDNFVASGVTEYRGLNGTARTNTNTYSQGTSFNAANGNGKYNTAAEVFAPFANAGYVTDNLNNPLVDLSRGIAKLPGTVIGSSTVPSAPNLPNQSGIYSSSSAFTASNGLKYGVINTTLDELTDGTFGGVQNGTGLEATFVIVKGQLAAGKALPVFSSAASYNKVLYDFVDATELRFTGQWNSSILAPLASITDMGTNGGINGSVVVQSLTQSFALNQGNAFTGDLSGLVNTSSFRRVPEPGSLAIIGSAMAGLAWLRRRRTR